LCWDHTPLDARPCFQRITGAKQGRLHRLATRCGCIKMIETACYLRPVTGAALRQGRQGPQTIEVLSRETKWQSGRRPGRC